MASDHDIVLANFKMKLNDRRCPKSIRIIFHLNKLEELEMESGVRVPDSDWCKVRSPQSDWPPSWHYRQRHQIIATGTSWRGTGEETKTIQIWIMNQIVDLCDERRELKRWGKKAGNSKEVYDILNDLTKRRVQAQNELCAKTKNPVFVVFAWMY